LRYGPEGFVVRTGWADAAAPVSAGPAAPTPAAATAVSSEQLKAVVQGLENRLLELERAQSTQTVKASATMPAGITAPELRKILAQNEARQREETNLQLAQMWKDFSAARVSDFTRMQDVVGRAQGVTNQQLRQHRDSIEQIYRASLSQQR
jgi:uncharacterized protein (UPF0335 family)